MQLMGWVFVGTIPAHTCNETFSNISRANVSSVTVDWNLICERAGLHATVGAAPMVGYLLGGLLFGSLSDKFGRRRITLFSTLWDSLIRTITR